MLEYGLLEQGAAIFFSCQTYTSHPVTYVADSESILFLLALAPFLEMPVILAFSPAM